jgi:HK97 family phage major capsid protein
MAIHSVVLETALGEAAEGTVIQVDESVAAALISSGVAREATAEDLGGAVEEVTEEAPEEGDEGVQEEVARIARDANATVTKATEKAVEKLTSVRRPGVAAAKVPVNRHVGGSDEHLTGGFKSIGDATHAWLRKSQGDFTAAKKFDKYNQLMRTKTNMSIGGSSGHVGGDLVPEQWAKDLWKLSFDKVPDLLGMCHQYPMDNQVLNIPAWQQTSPTAAITSAVIAEGSEITATNGVTATTQLSLVKFAALVNVSDELLRFNSYALSSVLEQTVPQRIRYTVNDSIVNGTNSQVDLVGNAAAVTVLRAVNSRFSYADIVKMEAALFDDFVEGAVWLINNSSSPELYSLSFPNTSATTQFPAFAPGGFGNLLGPKPMGELLGKPVYRLENVPALGNKGDLILYNPGSIAAGSSGLIADRTPYLYFNLAQDTFRFIWYADTVNPMTTYYTRKDGSKASNIVVLSATSSS